MLQLEYSSVAEKEQRQIASDIRAENPSAAGKWVIALEETCRMLATFPRMGRRRDDLRQGVYLFPYGNYLVFYDITDIAVIIVHVVHGARNLPDVFRAEEAEG